MSECKASQGFTDLSQKQANKKAKPVLPLLYLKLETQLSLGFSLIFVFQVKPKIESLSSNQKYTFPPKTKCVCFLCQCLVHTRKAYYTEPHSEKPQTFLYTFYIFPHFCLYCYLSVLSFYCWFCCWFVAVS